MTKSQVLCFFIKAFLLYDSSAAFICQPHGFHFLSFQPQRTSHILESGWPCFSCHNSVLAWGAVYDQQASVVIDSDYDADVVVVSCTCRMIKDKITRSGTLAVHHLACIPLCCGMIADTGILAAKSVIVRPCNKSTTVQPFGLFCSFVFVSVFYGYQRQTEHIWCKFKFHDKAERW